MGFSHHAHARVTTGHPHSDARQYVPAAWGPFWDHTTRTRPDNPHVIEYIPLYPHNPVELRRRPPHRPDAPSSAALVRSRCCGVLGADAEVLVVEAGWPRLKRQVAPVARIAPLRRELCATRVLQTLTLGRPAGW